MLDIFLLNLDSCSKFHPFFCIIQTFSVKFTPFTVKLTLFLYLKTLLINPDSLVQVFFHVDSRILVDVVVRLGSVIDIKMLNNKTLINV